MQDRKLRHRDAAVKLGLPIGAVYALVCQRRLPHLRLGPRLVVFSETELDGWLDAHRVPAASDQNRGEKR